MLRSWGSVIPTEAWDVSGWAVQQRCEALGMGLCRTLLPHRDGEQNAGCQEGSGEAAVG